VPVGGLDFYDSLPGVAARLEGLDLVAHFDSGGSYLMMSPDKAKSLGIKLMEGQRSFAALSWDRSFYGIAESFRLGGALLENVPVIALPQLKGKVDRVYFGTYIIEPFLSTFDFTTRRLILSPRGDEMEKEKQLALLGAKRVEVPFYLWSDRFMFARGSIGEEKNLNFFVDSGLFFVVPEESGNLHRGSLLSSKENCLRWGMKPEEAKRASFERPLPISLGNAREKKLYIQATPFGSIAENFGGVRIDALLSNGFLSRYAWTIHFDKRVNVLSRSE